ncbi:MAG: YsnF/AvaK domain-containing protein [Chloroflexia bacterium]
MNAGMAVDCLGGRLGTLDRVQGRGKSRLLVVLADGDAGADVLHIPVRYVEQVVGNAIQLNLSCDKARSLRKGDVQIAAIGSANTRELDTGETLTVPVIEETLVPVKSWQDAGVIEVRKIVQTVTQELDVPLQYEEALVERVAVNRILAETEQLVPYQDGDTLIVPVVREELVVTKQRMLVEELRITKRVRSTTRHIAEPVQREEVEISHKGLEEHPTNMPGNRKVTR